MRNVGIQYIWDFTKENYGRYIFSMCSLGIFNSLQVECIRKVLQNMHQQQEQNSPASENDSLRAGQMNNPFAFIIFIKNISALYRLIYTTITLYTSSVAWNDSYILAAAPNISRSFHIFGS